MCSPASFTLYSSDLKYKSQSWRRFRWAKKCHGPWLITPLSIFSVSFFQLMFLFCLVSCYLLSLSSVPICVKLVCLVFSGLIFPVYFDWLCALFLSSDHFQFSSYSLSVSVFFCAVMFPVSFLSVFLLFCYPSDSFFVWGSSFTTHDKHPRTITLQPPCLIVGVMFL